MYLEVVVVALGILGGDKDSVRGGWGLSRGVQATAVGGVGPSRDHEAKGSWSAGVLARCGQRREDYGVGRVV